MGARFLILMQFKAPATFRVIQLQLMRYRQSYVDKPGGLSHCNLDPIKLINNINITLDKHCLCFLGFFFLLVCKIRV